MLYELIIYVLSRVNALHWLLGLHNYKPEIDFFFELHVDEFIHSF